MRKLFKEGVFFGNSDIFPQHNIHSYNSLLMNNYFLLYFSAILIASSMAQTCSYRRKNFVTEWKYDQLSKQMVFFFNITNPSTKFLSGIAIGDSSDSVRFNYFFFLVI